MTLIDTTSAVGHVLCHDLTQIIPGEFKGPRFRKGHVVTEADIPILLSMGKEHLYVWEAGENTLHEDEAAELLRTLTQGEHMCASTPKEGKIELTAACDGLFLVDVPRLKQLNSLGEISVAARFSGFPVKAGDVLCGMRVIPLVISKAKLDEATRIVTAPLLQLKPFPQKKCGVITTGSEVASGLIEDKFTPVLREKLAEYGCEISAHVTLGDDPAQITAAILEMLASGVDMVLCTGGMSVDPDDRTPLAIKNAGVEIVSYGAPVLPGAMFLLSYTADGRPVCGLPGCVMYSKRTIFDLVLPRLLTDVPITAGYLSSLGNGGLCLNCEVCTYPNCMFGKGA